jgi:hypothetical protein
VSRIHLYIGYTIPAGFALLALASLVSFLRNREPGGWFWTVLGVLQVVVGVQVIVGAILFLSGLRPTGDLAWLHYAYGGLFPAAILVAAHRFSGRHAEAAWIFFGIASLLNAGLTTRALMTGLGTG